MKSTHPSVTPDLSVLIPVYNEVANVAPLHAELTTVLGGMPLRYELIFVDDGSTDGTSARLGEIQDADPEHVRVAFSGGTSARPPRCRPGSTSRGARCS